MMDYRYYPEFQAVSEAVQNGLIGEPVHIFTQKSYKNGPKSEWWGLHRKSGGIISWVGSHSADWIIRCCPEKIVQVSATVSRLHNRENNELESSAACIIKFANGGQAIMSIDYLNPKTAERHGDDRLRIAGSAGVAEVINCKGEVINRDGAKELPVEEKKMIFREFVSSIYNGTEFRQSREDLIRLTTLCIKLQEAADKNAIIKTDI
jgi:predicted dehydrogenase